ncbi:hypothetical protein [uncultured Desulfovibrio sp.]|uniref:hypothetical protein n=1 Tax=uncultured Desulfovibrio sp. TaxID=167968 RepID=UPI002634D58C|nr:hypothetical protein [uncultured Desulfovibrio sp.]
MRQGFSLREADGLSLPELEAWLELLAPRRPAPAAGTGGTRYVSKRMDWKRWKRAHGGNGCQR